MWHIVSSQKYKPTVLFLLRNTSRGCGQLGREIKLRADIQPNVQGRCRVFSWAGTVMRCDRVAENIDVDGTSQGQGKKGEEMVALYQDDVDNG